MSFFRVRINAHLLSQEICSVSFNDCVKSGECPDKLGIVAYYSNRCPYTDYYVNGVLRVLAQEINIPLSNIEPYQPENLFETDTNTIPVSNLNVNLNSYNRNNYNNNYNNSLVIQKSKF